MSAAVYFFAGLAVLCGVLGGLLQIGERIDGAFLISGLLGAIGGALVALAQRHLVRSRQMLREAAELNAAAHQRWRESLTCARGPDDDDLVPVTFSKEEYAVISLTLAEFGIALALAKDRGEGISDADKVRLLVSRNIVRRIDDAMKRARHE